MTANLIVPEEIRFAVTRKCDGACRHCYNRSGEAADRLGAEDINGLIKEVHSMNPAFDRITLTGGEPLLETDKVLKISRYAKSLGIRVRLVTRGWELNAGLCRELKASGVTRCQIGLDSSGESSYCDDDQRGWDTFHSWLRDDPEGFKKSVDAIKVSVASGMDVSVRYSLCRKNKDDVIRTFRFASSLGVSKFKFRVLFPDGRAKKGLIPELITGKDLAEAQHDLIFASQGNRTLVEITQPCSFALPGISGLANPGNRYNAFKERCPCGKSAAYIDANGDVKYCLFDEVKLGNIADQPFLEVWNSSSAQRAREQRCPLDESGKACSSFRILYSQFKDYGRFEREYVDTVDSVVGMGS